MMLKTKLKKRAVEKKIIPITKKKAASAKTP